MYQVELRPLRSPAFAHWEKEVEKIFDGFQKMNSYFPACDFVDSENYYLISIDIPGLAKDEIDIEVKDNQLIVTGERKARSLAENDRLLRTEKRVGKFSRAFTIPQKVGIDGIIARVENGVLELTLPKEEKTTAKKIAITEYKN